MFNIIWFVRRKLAERKHGVSYRYKFYPNNTARCKQCNLDIRWIICATWKPWEAILECGHVMRWEQ